MSDVRSSGGIFLGRLPAHTNYESRFQRVLERLVKGFFFKLHRRRLPKTFQIVIVESPTEDCWREMGQIADGLAQNGCYEPMVNVFRLWSTYEQNRRDVTFLYMVFLEAKDFLCFTVPIDDWHNPRYLQPISGM